MHAPLWSENVHSIAYQWYFKLAFIYHPWWLVIPWINSDICNISLYFGMELFCCFISQHYRDMYTWHCFKVNDHGRLFSNLIGIVYYSDTLCSYWSFFDLQRFPGINIDSYKAQNLHYRQQCSAWKCNKCSQIQSEKICSSNWVWCKMAAIS